MKDDQVTVVGLNGADLKQSATGVAAEVQQRAVVADLGNARVAHGRDDAVHADAMLASALCHLNPLHISIMYYMFGHVNGYVLHVRSYSKQPGTNKIQTDQLPNAEILLVWSVVFGGSLTLSIARQRDGSPLAAAFGADVPPVSGRSGWILEMSVAARQTELVLEYAYHVFSRRFGYFIGDGQA